MKLEWNKDKLLSLLSNNEYILRNEYSHELMIEIITLKEMLKKVDEDEFYKESLKKLNEFYQKDNKQSTFSLPLCELRIPQYSTFFNLTRKLKESEVIQLMPGVLEEDAKKCFSRLLNEQRINIDKSGKKGITYYLDNSKEIYINVGFSGRISDIRLLAHEIGHATQFEKINNFRESYNLFNNNFKETKAILYELISLDKNNFSKKDKLKESNNFNTTYNFILDMAYQDDIKPYYYSFMLAIYLFNLYKTDIVKYQEYLSILDEGILVKSESDILKEMKINGNDIFNSYKKYVKKNSSR